VGTPYLDDPALLSAYLEHLAPKSHAKALAVLREIYPAGTPAPRRVIDVGSGPGPMAQAARELFPDAEVVATDRSERALAAVPPGITRVRWDALRAPSAPATVGRADLVLLGNLLNELPGDAAERIEGLASATLAPGGTLVIIEPALRETARALELARDRLIDRGWFVVAPCFYRGGCPALARDRDWCHEDRSRRGDADPDALTFAYLVLRREGSWSDDLTLARVVSARMIEKGRQKLWACGPAGRRLFTRLDRHRTASNEAWDCIERGDVISIDGAEPRAEEMRVSGPARVTIVKPVVR
jgi:SAM-dependent methyltransferase